MRSATTGALFLSALSCFSGCQSGANPLTMNDTQVSPPAIVDGSTPSTNVLGMSSGALSGALSHSIAANQSRQATEDAFVEQSPADKHGLNLAPQNLAEAIPIASDLTAEPEITQVGFSRDNVVDRGSITIDGKTYGIQLVAQSQIATESAGPNLQQVPGPPQSNIATPYEQGTAQGEHHTSQNDTNAVVTESSPYIVEATDPNALLLNLPSALALIDEQHPAVGFARWKVQEAYANLDQAKALWLPNIQTGLSFHRHDGNYQASNGSVVDVHRNSFQFGFGAGATGAGTTPRPGLQARFHLADALFQPDIARKTAWATDHAEKATVNRQLRDVAIAYVKLLDAHQQLRILNELKQRTTELKKITTDFAEAGEGLQADADRMQTELTLVEARIASARESVDVTSSQLTQILSADTYHSIVPMDSTVTPIDLVDAGMDRGSLIANGLRNRPELKQLQALVAAACERHQREKYAPFVPSVLLGLSGSGFGGGQGNTIKSVNERYDLDAMMTWEIRNLGFGEESARKRTAAQTQQAMFKKTAMIDNVAREISEAHSQVTHRKNRIAITQDAIQSATSSYDRNLSRIRDGEGLPIEALLSLKGLEAARFAYLDAVVAYNEAQFQLQYAMGWQVTSDGKL